MSLSPKPLLKKNQNNVNKFASLMLLKLTVSGFCLLWVTFKYEQNLLVPYFHGHFSILKIACYPDSNFFI